MSNFNFTTDLPTVHELASKLDVSIVNGQVKYRDSLIDLADLGSTIEFAWTPGTNDLASARSSIKLDDADAICPSASSQLPTTEVSVGSLKYSLRKGGVWINRGSQGFGTMDREDASKLVDLLRLYLDAEEQA